MDTLLLLARLLLAAVFLVASISKFADLRGSARAMREFGVPEPWTGPLGFALPVAEMAIALLLIPGRAAFGAALGAFVLLGAFIAAIGFNLAQGKQPDCHCFGQLYSEPIGASTLIRNLLLAAVAAFIVVEGRPTAGASALHWLTQISGTEKIGLALGTVILVLIGVQMWFLTMLLRQNGRLMVRTEALEQALAAGGFEVSGSPESGTAGLPSGSPAPAFALPGLYGEILTLDVLLANGHPVLLIFSDPQCGPCTALMPDIRRWQAQLADRITIAEISRGSLEDNRAKASEYAVSNVLIQEDDEVANAFASPGTPSAVLISADGNIATQIAVGADGIRSLANSLMPQPGSPTIPLLDRAPAPVWNVNAAAPMFERGSLRIGENAPDFELPDLTGHSVRLSDFRGSNTVLLFWNPACGFCGQMLPDLQAWEQRASPNAPRLLVISSGDVEENRMLGIRAPVLLDDEFATGTAFGANGTPMAVLLDEEGRLASEIAVGAAGVFDLAAHAEHAPVGG